MPRLGFVLFALSSFLAAASEIQFTNNTFVFLDSNSSVTISASNGSILSINQLGRSGHIAASGEFGLWAVTNEQGSTIAAASFATNSASNLFSCSLLPSGNVLVLNYSNAAIHVTITASNRDDGIDFSAQVQPQSATSLELDLPARLRFSPTNLSRLIGPLNSSDGLGASFNSAFFQPQPTSAPAAWTNSLAGDAGYISLYGSSLTFIPTADPPAPVTLTVSGVAWLGTNLATNYDGAAAMVNRPPAAGQSDLTLVTSTNGAFFSASHLGGSGYLFRLGGEIDDSSTNLAQDVVIAAIEHLAQNPHAASRTNVALLNLIHGPPSGGWAAVPVTTWSNRLVSSAILTQAGIQIVQVSNVQSMLAETASNTCLAIINPYGEWLPALPGSGITASVSAVGAYVRGGGNWFETGGYSFYYALLPALYYSYGAPYPPAFADFLQVESPSGTASLYGVQPDTNAPWTGSNNLAALFVPGRLAWGADALGGYCERAFETYVAPGQTWTSPIARLTVGYDAPTALSNYSQANAYTRGLSDKMSPALLDQFQNSVLVYYNGDCADKTTYANLLPSPALVHFADYLMGGFDHEYPDDLPPNASFGTPSQFTNFLYQAHQLGLLTMPYSNPTWWPNDPPGPTFVSAGDAPLLRNLDGSLSYEIYGANYGYTVCDWHPVVQAANRLLVGEFTTNYPVDLLFEDQCGARTWQYDLNPASPTPYAYSTGIASRLAEDSATFPISTEDGWDRLVNHASQFCGMCWATVPTANPPSWQTFLRDRFDTSTWDIYPVAQYIAHDKVSFILHDLGQFVTSNEQLAWVLGLGYGLSDYVNASDLAQPDTLQWLLWLDRVQKSVCSRYVGQPISAFAHAWGAHDNGVIQSAYGPVTILANLSPNPVDTNGLTLAPFGFYATAAGITAGNLLFASDTNSDPSGLSFVTETNAVDSAQFWVYTTGEQTASVPLPFGSGPATIQLDGHAANQVNLQNGALSVALGMTPTQDRVQPPPALAGLPPITWPGHKPSIGVLDLSGIGSAWTTVNAAAWAQAISNSLLSTEFNLRVLPIATFVQLTNVLAAGPAGCLAIINPNGEVFPESASNEWPATFALIQNYVNNGGSWWETGGYSFYSAAWPQDGSWPSQTVGPSGMDTFGIPVGGGAVDQPHEPLNVTPLGETFFGPALSAQLQGLSTAVNRGLLPTSDGDPGHIALLSGSDADFLGAYRLGGWGYFWRFGGFYPNPEIVTNALPAVMAYIYTNPPLPALVSSVNYLWHGNVTFLPQPTIRAAIAADGSVNFQITNCPLNSTSYLQRAADLTTPVAWQTVFTFTASQTNWTDPSAPTLPAAFYRILTTQ